jgi:DNA-binding NarL/FixJ family response regulator
MTAASAGMAPADTAAFRLTPQERLALAAAASGLTRDAAARVMGLSARTLRRFQRDACDRLGVATPIQAVAILAAAGLIDAGWVRRQGPLPAWPFDLSAKARAGYTGAAAQVARGRANGARVAALIAEGLSEREVAEATGLCLATVRKHARAAGGGG